MSISCPKNSFQSIDNTCICYPGFEYPECTNQRCSQQSKCIGDCLQLNTELTICSDSSCSPSYKNEKGKCIKQCSKCEGFCLDSGCISCMSGFFKDQNKCTKCNFPCVTCQSPNFCLSCPSTYFIQSGKCLKCGQNCISCISSNTCIQCESNYFLSNNKCIPGCSNVQNCGFCDNNLCLSCRKNYQLISNSCIFCGNGCLKCDQTHCLQCEAHMALQNGTCIFCASPYCDSCENDYKTCSKCVVSSALQNGDCVPCSNILGCLECANPVNNCILCASNFHRKGGICIFNNCSEQNCQENEICVQGKICECVDGFQRLYGICTKISCKDGCLENCVENGENQAISCKKCTDLFIQGTSTCIAGCLNCKSNQICVGQTYCENCHDGSFSNGLFCVQCQQNCLKCDQNSCTECKKNSLIQGKQCVSCLSRNCIRCSQANQCDECQAGYYLLNGSCTANLCDFCGNNEFCDGQNCHCKFGYKKQNDKCVEIVCNDYCQNCDSNGICIEKICSSNSILIKNQLCVQSCLNCKENEFCNQMTNECQQCQDDFYFDKQQYICRFGQKCQNQLIFDCLQCNNDQCTQCSPNKYLSNGICTDQKPCEIQFCEKCFLNKCLQCQPDYLLSFQGKQCIKNDICMIKNCIQCSPTQCTTCADGLKPSQNGQNCGICGSFQGCLKCQNSNLNFCAQCDNKSIFDGAKCISCESGMESINNICVSGAECRQIQFCRRCNDKFGYQCEECEIGSEMIVQGSSCGCAQIENCGQCFNEKCVQCYQQFNLISEICYPRVACAGVEIFGCSTCNDRICAECVPGYGLNSTKNCEECSILCSTCSMSDHCLTCKGQEKPVNGTCGCSENCLSCEVALSCSSCNSGHFLNDLNCVKSCLELGKLEVFQRNICGKCEGVKECSYCEFNDLSKCAVCVNGKMAKNGICVQKNDALIYSLVGVVCVVVIGVIIFIFVRKSKKNLFKKVIDYEDSVVVAEI